MCYIATIHSDGKVTIPLKVREMLKLSNGDSIVFYDKDEKIFIEKADISPQENK